MNPNLETPCVRLRARAARGLASDKAPPSTSGGMYDAGVIYGASIVTRGEALGHEFWCDGVFLQQVHDAINATKRGIKSRFAHPGLSGDGVGKVLGRAMNAAIDGDIVRADIHFLKTAHRSPDGNLAEYVIDLAAEDPELFGTSIVFEPDGDSEEAFYAEHVNEEGDFVSPDAQNENNLRHARLGKLWAADVVDEPAANPGGMFSRRQEIAYEANALAEYMIGLSDSPPLIEELGIEPERARQFWLRFLDTHGNVSVAIQKEIDMAGTATKSDAQSVQVDADALRAEGARVERERFAALAKAFHADPSFLADMIALGKTAEEAEPLWLKRENERLSAELAELKARLEDEEDEDEEEMEGNPEDEECEGEPDDEEEMEGEPEDEEEMEDEKPEEEMRRGVRPKRYSARTSGGDFISVAGEYARANKCSIGDAQSHVARTQPALFAAYKASLRPSK